MPRVMIECPETRKLVYTGLNLDWFAFESTQLGENALRCPSCGGVHAWDKKDVQLVADGGEG